MFARYGRGSGWWSICTGALPGPWRFGELPAPGLVHVAGPAGGLCRGDPDAAAPFLSTFFHLQAGALSRDATAARLRHLAEVT